MFKLQLYAWRNGFQAFKNNLFKFSGNYINSVITVAYSDSGTQMELWNKTGMEGELKAVKKGLEL